MVVALVGVVTLIGLVFVMPIAGIRDASRYPDGAWSSAGMSKKSWIAAMACGPIFIIPFLSLVGIAASGLYWASRRKRLVVASRTSSRGLSLGGGFRR